MKEVKAKLEPSVKPIRLTICAHICYSINYLLTKKLTKIIY